MEIQERQIRKRLLQDFEPSIDISDSASHGVDEQAKIRTSRALAALSVAANAKLSVEESCASVVDEPGDAGIDAIGITLSLNEIYVVQSKSSKGSPSPTEVMKFTEGVRRLLDWDWEALGKKTKRRQAEIENALEGSNARVVAIFSHLGSQPPNDEALRSSNRLLDEVNKSGDILEFRYEGLRENFDHRNIASGLGSPDSELTFDRWVTISDYRSEIMGFVGGEQLARMVESFNDRLFDRNIRSILKSTETNEILDSTLRDTPSDFWYYNNGITIVANSISCKRTNPRSVDESFMLQGLSVVNGAQTCGALARILREGNSLDDVRVTVRVISTEGHSGDFEKLVTRYTNTQNQITSREFVSLDPYQQELRDTLLAEKIQYTYRTGQVPDDVDFEFSFDLEEATRALACLNGVVNATRAKREIGRMWSDIKSAPYTELFPRNLNAAEMYNAVRFWRYYNRILSSIAMELDPREARIIQNSSYVGCALMMQSYRRDGQDLSQIDANIENWLQSKTSDVKNMSKICIKLHEQRNGAGYPLSFFKNLQKVERFATDLRQEMQNGEVNP